MADSKDEGEGCDRHVVFGEARLESVGVGTTRHAHDAQGVHGPERCVVGGKADEEMPETEGFVELASSGFGIPIVDCREQRKDGSANEHIVEVSHHEVRVVEVDVKTSHREEHSRDTAEREGYKEA